MHFSRSFITRPVATVLTMLTLVVFGVFTLQSLPVALVPNIVSTTFSINCTYPGASPKQVADLVTAPLESQFLSIQGVKYLTSTSSYGTSSIMVQFHPSIDENDAATNIQQAISQAQGQLPALPSLPNYNKVNTADAPIMYIVIYSETQTQNTVYDYAQNILARQLSTIDGVADVYVYGNSPAVRVQVDPESLAAKGLTMNDVQNAINQNNPVQPTGKFFGPNFSIITEADGQMYQPEPYNSMIIKINNDNVVRLSDVGYAFDSSTNDQQSVIWFNKGDPIPKTGTFLAIYKQDKYNTVKVCKDLENKMEELGESIPQSIQYKIPLSQKNYVLEAIADIQLTLYIAFILVVVVVFLYLGRLRNSIIPLITLPITIIGTFIFMLFLGYNIDIMSLSALTLSTGFLVDDAIIVLENIVRHTEEGQTPQSASMNGSKQIFSAIISISACLCAVFIPMIYIPGIVGQLFSELAGVVIIAIFLSGFISVTLTPMLCSRFIPNYNQTKKSYVEELSIAFNEYLKKLYTPLLKRSLEYKKTVLFGAFGIFLTSIWIAVSTPKEFLPSIPINAIVGYVIAENGASPEKTNQYLTQIGKIAHETPFIKGLCTVTDSPTDNMGVLFIILEDSEGSPPFEQILMNLYEKSAEVIGCNAYFRPLPLINIQTGSTSRAEFQFVVTATDQKTVEEKAQLLMNAMQLEPEFTTVNSDLSIGSPVFNINMLRDQARAYGNITPLDIENILAYSYGQTYVSTIYNPNSVNYVILELKNQYKTFPDEISRLFLGPKNGNTNMTSVFKGSLTATTNMVNHFNSLPSCTISFNVPKGYTISEAIDKLQMLGPTIFEGKASGFLAGSTAEFKSSMIHLFVLFVLALFAIYIVLGILYENFLHPLTPLSAVPFAAFGGLLTLQLLGVKFSVYAMIGIIMLMGIVMKNGILIVDFALEEIEKNPEFTPEEAITKASMIRFRPILMTTLAAMMGAVPVAAGIGGIIAESRAPLGIAIVGGLIFAQMMSLIVGPVVFTYVMNWSKKLTSKQGGLFAPIAELETKTTKE